MNKCIVLDDATDWQQRAEQAEAFAMTLQTQRDEAEAETAQTLEALTIAREALEAIDRHVVGECEPPDNFPYPCEECGEMREIAHQALAAMKRSR